jgi:putative ATP-binding cassette transporter
MNRLKFLQLIRQEIGGFPSHIPFTVALSGVANAVGLAIINRASAAISAGAPPSTRDLFLFAIVIFTYIYCLRHAFKSTANMFAQIIHQVRVRLVDKIRRADLITQEHIGRGVLYNNLVQELQVISQSQTGLVSALQAFLMVVVTTFYMASLSIPGFLVTAAVVLSATFYYLKKLKMSQRSMARSTQLSVLFVDQLNHVLDGFKEIKMSRARSNEIQADIEQSSGEARHAAVETASINTDLFIFSQGYFYFLMALIIFLLPKFTATYAASITALTTTILFLLGPLAAIVSSIPAFTRFNLAVKNIFQLEALLDQNQPQDPGWERHLRESYEQFSQITFSDVEFSYLDRDGTPLFKVGPLNLTIKRGEILFLVGGNGSGKSSLLKLLTGLYFPDRGSIMLDRERITRANSQDYRELFSIIFSDFHLFLKLYGIKNIDQEKVDEFLKLMALADKTTFLGDRFSHTDLSTGQRKRLALLITYLEDRSIYVFDEWAADQDPEFREHFYKVMLAELQTKGKTVIAVSHDDRYFHVADRVVKMEYGKIVSEVISEKAAQSS